MAHYLLYKTYDLYLDLSFKKNQKMRITLALLCFLVIVMMGFSQEITVNLNKYKFPDYKRHQLELNFNTSGDIRKQTYEYLNNMNTWQTEDNSYATNNSSFQLGYDYNYLTRKRMDYINSTFSGSYSDTHSKYGDQKASASNPTITGVLNGFRRYYLIENTFFLEGLTNMNYNFYKSERKTPHAENDYFDKNNSFHISVGLGLGLGRMERVSDLWQASYILEKLNKQKALSRQLEERDIFEFATLASQLKNKRFLDFRIRRTYELKALDSLLHQQGLINESDIAYFTTLNDYWSYGNFPNRVSGVELKFWAAPDYTYYSSETKQYSPAYNSFNSNENQKTSLISNVSFNWTKQLNLYWERNLNAQVSYEILLDTIGNNFYYPDNDMRTNVNFGYGFYPNSRTDLHAAISYLRRTIESRN